MRIARMHPLPDQEVQSKISGRNGALPHDLSELRSWPRRRLFDKTVCLAGSLSPSSPTTQSCATGDFLKVYERPRIGGDRCDRSFTETARYSRQVVSAHFSLAPKSRFPE